MDRRFLKFALLQILIIFGLIWVIAGNDRLFRSTVPIEQRLISRNESIRKKAQQELLGLETDDKKRVVENLIPVLASEDSTAVKWAAISLALVGSAAQEAIPALLQCVSAHEKDVAQAARVALSEIGAPDAQQLPSLLRTLQDPRETVRCEAALSIGKMGPSAQEAAPLLVAVLQRPESTPACFEEAAATLAGSLPEMLVPVTELLTSGHVEIRRKAAHVLAMAGARTAEVIRPLLDLLSRETDALVRTRLRRALQLPYKPEWNMPAVLACALSAKNSAVRLEAARLLRQNPPRGAKALPYISKMLGDSDPAIRRLGVEMIRKSGARSSELLQKVGKAQRDPDPGVRIRAVEILVEAGATDRVSVPLLIEDLKADDEIARAAERALSMAGLFNESVVRSMIRLLEQETDPELRSRAVRILMQLGAKARDAVPALTRAQKDQIPGADMALRAIRSNPRRGAK